MNNEREQIRKYFDAAQPSEEFQRKLLALEQTQPNKVKKPRYALRIAAAAAACLALGVIGWNLLGLKHGSPNLVPPVEPAAQTEAPADAPTDETVSISPSASAEGTEPTETPMTQEQIEPPEETDPTTTATTQQTDPPAQDEPVEPTGSGWTTGTQEPKPTEPSEDVTPTDPPETSRPTEDPGPAAEGDMIAGWYERSWTKEYVVLRNNNTGEMKRIDVTGRLSSGHLEMEVTAFGLTLWVEVVHELVAGPGSSTGSDAPDDDYCVTVTVL